MNILDTFPQIKIGFSAAKAAFFIAVLLMVFCLGIAVRGWWDGAKVRGLEQDVKALEIARDLEMQNARSWEKSVNKLAPAVEACNQSIEDLKKKSDEAEARAREAIKKAALVAQSHREKAEQIARQPASGLKGADGCNYASQAFDAELKDERGLR